MSTRITLLFLLVLVLGASTALGQGPLNLPGLPELEERVAAGTGPQRPVGEVYGFINADVIFDSGANDPDWFDAMRPSKLPSFEGEFGKGGNTHFSVRQTRFGVKSWVPTEMGQLKGILEGDLFGVGPDAGQTTLRLRHAYFEIGKFGAGQYHSPFMDASVFPRSQNYWGPSGMDIYRNVQVRYMPVMSDRHHVSVALEKPGASGDGGIHDEILREQGLTPRFPVPDLSAEYRHTRDGGYVEIAGVLRRIQWDDLTKDEFDLSGGGTGWGFNLSSNLSVGSTGSLIKGSVLYGEGIENYVFDALADVAVVEDFSDPVSPLKGELLPVFAFLGFYELHWNPRWTSTMGYSLVDVDYGGTAVRPDTFVTGHYAVTNIQYHPRPDVWGGVELQWLKRENFSDGFSYGSWRVQCSFRYSYSIRLQSRE